ncbi:MAG: type III toxin-antitoxin system ToxN/AbiQ family toxin [Clostridia bacterium]|nr:type III toxin-antitoxin system ToxN/AbiQ family toxin [Clostridia bacterium]
MAHFFIRRFIAADIKFYHVDENYIRYLKQYDERVPFAFGSKKSRPFIGVLLEVNQINYFAPLTSLKNKNIIPDMFNVDFVLMKNNRSIKIAGKYLGGINLNNMIPIYDFTLLKEIKFKKIKNEAYRDAINNEFIWCRKNQDMIIKKAKNVYYKYINCLNQKKTSDPLFLRCCDFKLLEEAALLYKGK